MTSRARLSAGAGDIVARGEQRWDAQPTRRCDFRVCLRVFASVRVCVSFEEMTSSEFARFFIVRTVKINGSRTKTVENHSGTHGIAREHNGNGREPSENIGLTVGEQ